MTWYALYPQHVIYLQILSRFVITSIYSKSYFIYSVNFCIFLLIPWMPTTFQHIPTLTVHVLLGCHLRLYSVQCWCFVINLLEIVTINYSISLLRFRHHPNQRHCVCIAYGRILAPKVITQLTRLLKSIKAKVFWSLRKHVVVNVKYDVLRKTSIAAVMNGISVFGVRAEQVISIS